jgi:HD-GYP domain-containing protein (c-di-GMP phosphodiesterase class II)
VLNKPGPLDLEEMRIVRAHPLVGAELIRAAGLPLAARFVLEHHEWMDGSGYPAGLRGDEISLEGRILHAADAYAAMTSDRPYRKAMGVEEAIAELRDGSGRQFDARVAEVLEDVVRAREVAWSLTPAELLAPPEVSSVSR